MFADESVDSVDERGTAPYLQEDMDESDFKDILRNRRIVIAEDEGITLLLLKTFLSHAGLSVVGTAVNGERAYETITRERPEIVLLDIKLPGPMNGLDTARKVFEVYRPCVLILSAYSDYRDEARELGINGYIVKPVEKNKLLAEITEAYQQYRSSLTSH
ncbi:MAG: response regulator [Deltaproteobacteria bacterium]|nr:response regulator [Deltaproteobacteria bacterium]